MCAVTIIIPVKDEEDGLRFLLDDFQNSSSFADREIEFIFVIDERTGDASKSIAQDFSGTIIDQKNSTGKGSAIKLAISQWRKNRTKKIIFLDADGSYGFDSVDLLIQSLEEGAEVISGTRFLRSMGRPEGMSVMHNFGNKFLSKISSIRNGRKISDLCTGLWGFSEKALLNLPIKSNGFDLEAEIAGLCRRGGLNHSEIPVSWSQRKGGTSKLRSLTDGLIILLRIIRT